MEIKIKTHRSKYNFIIFQTKINLIYTFAQSHRHGCSFTSPHAQPYHSHNWSSSLLHYGIIKWKHFPPNWSFAWGIHRSRWIPHTKASAVTRSFDVFFDLRLNKRLSKQPWGWWFETPSWSLRRQCNVHACAYCTLTTVYSHVYKTIGVVAQTIMHWYRNEPNHTHTQLYFPPKPNINHTTQTSQPSRHRMLSFRFCHLVSRRS